jgi:hypothetical protein
VNKKILRLALVVGLLSLVLPAAISAQNARARSIATAAKPGPSLLASLPESDAVAIVKVKRALDEAMPKMLSGNPAKLAEANAQIDQFKTRTGIDPRQFDEMAVGVRYSYPREGVTKLESVGLARGTFNPAAMVAAGRIAADGKYREEKYQGKMIYIFTLDQDVRLFGLIKFRVGEFAASPVDSTTLAVGDPDAVRNVIDVNRGKKRVSAELVALASRDPQAIAGFGGNISPELIRNMDIGNRAITQDLSSVRQVYGSFGVTDKDVEMFFAARTVNEEAAKNLGSTLEGLKQLGALFVGRLSAAKGALARNALNNLKITTQANELMIRTAVAQSSLAPIIGGF